MTTVSANQKIYHITHVRNLSQIVQSGVLLSDAKRIDLALESRVVGMSKIKHRRMHEIMVDCHPGTRVGEYVPFYFCPRSIMLYILYVGNHPEIEYREGQRPIVHLQADLTATIRWANENITRWAFSDRNAGVYIAQFYNTVADLGELNWEAVNSTDFRDTAMREGKQAEFLVYEKFPWALVERIGVVDEDMVSVVNNSLKDARHRPLVRVERNWYY